MRALVGILLVLGCGSSDENPDAPCGYIGSPCCNRVDCNGAGTICEGPSPPLSGMCVHCGDEYEDCCGAQCGTNLSCMITGIYNLVQCRACGFQGEPCCDLRIAGDFDPNPTCQDDLVCSSDANGTCEPPPDAGAD
jgi:hypothetical protein